jgi:hypothetical protein
VTRLYAWSRVPGRDLILIVAMEQEETTRLATRMKWHIPRRAGFITVLLLAVGGLNQRGSANSSPQPVKRFLTSWLQWAAVQPNGPRSRTASLRKLYTCMSNSYNDPTNVNRMVSSATHETELYHGRSQVRGPLPLTRHPRPTG